MSYDRKKRFVLSFLVAGGYHNGLSIVDASNGLLRRGTVYQTLERMQEENLIRSKGEGRAWEREYRRLNAWER